MKSHREHERFFRGRQPRGFLRHTNTVVRLPHLVRNQQRNQYLKYTQLYNSITLAQKYRLHIGELSESRSHQPQLPNERADEGQEGEHCREYQHSTHSHFSLVQIPHRASPIRKKKNILHASAHSRLIFKEGRHSQEYKYTSKSAVEGA